MRKTYKFFGPILSYLLLLTFVAEMGLAWVESIERSRGVWTRTGCASDCPTYWGYYSPFDAFVVYAFEVLVVVSLVLSIWYIIRGGILRFSKKNGQLRRYGVILMMRGAAGVLVIFAAYYVIQIVNSINGRNVNDLGPLPE